MTAFLQNGGDTWCGDIMQGCGQTISTSGCYLTSFTMLQNYLKGTNLNPGQVNTRLGSYACPFNYSGAATEFGLSAYSTPSVADYKAKIIGLIDIYKPVMVSLNNPSGGLHCVLAKGYAGTTVLINDPDTHKHYTDLSQYINAGYTVSSLRYFS
ncbi:MAG: papain-like cysteine protease family protein [Oscillospiraceae bacterium]